MYLFVLSENLKTSLRSRTTVFPDFVGTFSFGARLTPYDRANARGNQPYPPASEFEAGTFPVWEGEFKPDSRLIA